MTKGTGMQAFLFVVGELMLLMHAQLTLTPFAF
jgi:hypothetical protein